MASAKDGDAATGAQAPPPHSPSTITIEGLTIVVSDEPLTIPKPAPPRPRPGPPAAAATRTITWAVGDKVFAVDRGNMWYRGRVVKIDPTNACAKVHFNGWSLYGGRADGELWLLGRAGGGATHALNPVSQAARRLGAVCLAAHLP